MLQLCGHDPLHALARRNLGRNWSCYGRTLLVADEASPPRRRRFPLGLTSRASIIGPAKPLRYAVRTVSAQCCAARVALRSIATGTGGWTFLGNQFVSSRLRTHASRLHQAPYLLRFSVLGRHPYRAVVTPDCCQRILPIVVARHAGQAASWPACVSDASEPPWSAGVRDPHARQPCGNVELAVALDSTAWKL